MNQSIVNKAVKCGGIDEFFRDHFRLEVASAVMSGVSEVGRSGCPRKIGDSTVKPFLRCATRSLCD